ncbi:MAG: PaaI family thioesterase [Elusimicrobiaceae bacterium]|nr:PaaI family thioesterase [Elusimicrobiaceae bacterium]MBP5617045.1 PaaI family thioesterase [Elusimicrobiaceae bacterium]
MEKLKQPTSLNCFACGKNNPFGLKLKWFNNYEQKQVETEFELSDNYCSYPGTVHGGIVATILDETSGRAILLNNDFARLMVTLKMEVVYKQNTPTNTKLKAIGRVLRDGGSRAQVEGEIVLPDGTVCASCKSILFKIPQAVQARFGSEADEWNRTTPQVPQGCNCGPEGHVCGEKAK